MGIGIQKNLKITILRYRVVPGSVFWDVSEYAGKLRIFQQYLVVAAMVLSAAWFFCWFFLLVLLLWCLTFSLICVRIRVGDLVKKPEPSFVLAFIIHDFFFFFF